MAKDNEGKPPPSVVGWATPSDLVRVKFGTVDDPVFTEEEAAAYLTVSQRTLQRIREGGQVRYIEFARKIFHRKSHLDEYILTKEMPAAHVRRRRRRKRNVEGRVVSKIGRTSGESTRTDASDVAAPPNAIAGANDSLLDERQVSDTNGRRDPEWANATQGTLGVDRPETPAAPALTPRFEWPQNGWGAQNGRSVVRETIAFRRFESSLDQWTRRHE
jgi:hypothetical protein